MNPAPLRTHVFQHVPYEGLGCIQTWLHRRNSLITVTRFFESADMPAPAAVDFLIVLGGPMSVHDDTIHPWLPEETGYVRRFLATGKPLLGICLGAQLIARALGARVYRNPAREIGWFPVYGLPPGENQKVFRFPPQVEVFHWHGETFDLPPGTTRLARSAACENQAFQIGSAIGLQFHLETTPQSAAALIAHARHELAPGPFVQAESDLSAAPPAKYQAVNRLMDDLLWHLLPSVSLPLSQPGLSGISCP